MKQIEVSKAKLIKQKEVSKCRNVKQSTCNSSIYRKINEKTSDCQQKRKKQRMQQNKTQQKPRSLPKNKYSQGEEIANDKHGRSGTVSIVAIPLTCARLALLRARPALRGGGASVHDHRRGRHRRAVTLRRRLRRGGLRRDATRPLTSTGVVYQRPRRLDDRRAPLRLAQI